MSDPITVFVNRVFTLEVQVEIPATCPNPECGIDLRDPEHGVREIQLDLATQSATIVDGALDWSDGCVESFGDQLALGYRCGACGHLLCGTDDVVTLDRDPITTPEPEPVPALRAGDIRYLRCTVAPFARQVRIVAVNPDRVTVEDTVSGDRYVLRGEERARRLSTTATGAVAGLVGGVR